MPCYLVRAGQTGRVKIGFSKNIQARMLHLQCSNPEHMHVLRSWDGGRKTEKWLQQHFAHAHVVREWFTFDPAMLTVEPPRSVEEIQATKPPKVLTRIEKIVSYFGSQTALARAIGVGQASVFDWIQSDRIPSTRIMVIVAAAAELDPPVELRLSDFFAVSSASEQTV